MRQSADTRSTVNDDDMRPEYDFSKGLRGTHAYRFGKLKSDESLILGYWQGKGFEVGSYSTNEMKKVRTPDFRLKKGGKDVALCEVKTFQYDTWLDDQIDKAAPGELADGLRTDPIYNRVSNAIHTAARQFQSVNPDHELLNFLVIVNRDTNARYGDLVSVITGFWDPMHGNYEITHAPSSEGRIRDEKKKIDLYVWIDIRKGGAWGSPHYFFGNADSTRSVCGLIGVDPEKICTIQTAA